MDRINGKTPEEIKRGLECCYDEDRALCEKCPYHYVRKDGLMRFTECSSMHSLGVDTMTYIQQLEAQVSRWVSVEERLPEPFVSVLVYMPSESPLPTVHEGYLGPRREWLAAHFGKVTGEVTHWAEMPDPPKEDKKC